MKKVWLVLLGVAFLSMSSFAFAEDIFVTKNGSKYHKENCRLIKNKGELTQLDKTVALEQGYTPCKVCYKEDLLGDQSQTEDKTKK